jgi:hypothetical protein
LTKSFNLNLAASENDEPCGIIVMLATQSFHAWLTIAFGMARAMQR